MSTSSETRTYNTELTATANAYFGSIRDQINKANLPFYLLNKDGVKRIQNGGERIEIALRLNKSTAGGFYANTDQLSTATSDPLTKAFYNWKQAHYSVVISGIEKFKNSGIGRELDMLQALFDDATDSFTETMNDAVFGTAGAKKMNGFQQLIAEDPTSSTGGSNSDGLIGGINQSTVTAWRNKVIGYSSAAMTWMWDMDGTAVPTGHTALEYLYENCSKGGGAKDSRSPNLIMCNQYLYRNYMLGMAKQKTYTNKDIAQAGFQNVLFNDAPMHWDESVASASIAAGSTTEALAYFINTNFMHLTVGAGFDFKKTDWVRPANQDAEICQILWYGNLGVSSRRKHGILADATAVSSNVL